MAQKCGMMVLENLQPEVSFSVQVNTRVFGGSSVDLLAKATEPKTAASARKKQMMFQ